MRFSVRHVWSHVAWAACCACMLAGCRFGMLADQDWEWPEATPSLPDATGSVVQRPAPKTVSLEIVFARADDHDATWQQQFWSLADEQAFDPAVRRRLAANGLRVGLLSGHLPPELAGRLEAAAPPTEPEDLPAASVERPQVVRRLLTLLPGRDNEVVAATRLEELILFEHDGDEVHGGTYRDATTLFSLKAWPAADGRVRIELVPTIKHGPLERSWVGEEGAFRLETGQRRQALDTLAITTTIPQGGTLLLGPVGDAASTVGDAFFLEQAGPRKARRLLAIRLRGRPTDPLFSTAAVPAAPTTSPAN